MSTPQRKIINKLPKQRKCLLKSCRDKFTPLRNGQTVCSAECGYKYAQEQKEKSWKKQKSETKDKMKTHSDWCNELQPRINLIARLIDKDQPCISSLRMEGKMAGGHRFSVGAHPSLRFNLLNIHQQSFKDNSHLSGNPDGYDHGLSCVYSDTYLEMVHELPKKYPLLKLTIPELIAANSKAKKIVNELKKLDMVYPPEVRILLRLKYNDRLAIYK